MRGRGGWMLALTVAIGAGMATPAASGGQEGPEDHRPRHPEGQPGSVSPFPFAKSVLGREEGAGSEVVPAPQIANSFRVLGHENLGAEDTHGDVWVTGNYAYVGTWGDPCTGLGVKIIDVSRLHHPVMVGRLAQRPGTSAEDVVVLKISTPEYTGRVLAAGIQRCGGDPRLDDRAFGVELWDVRNPRNPRRLGTIGLAHGAGGVHELDFFQLGDRAYVLTATNFSEWFDPEPGGDFRIIDVTDPRQPVRVGEWGAHAHDLAPGPFFGMGSFAASFAHSARASADGTKAYVSYWDLGVLTLDITDPSDPELIGRTEYPDGADGDAHSLVPYSAGGRDFLLQNDEDFDPRSPAMIDFPGGSGWGAEQPLSRPLWDLPDHMLEADVVMASEEGCVAGDYPASTTGAIAVVRTLYPYFDPTFDPETSPQPSCSQFAQEAAAAEAGAAAVVHQFVSEATSPQWFDFGEVAIPVLFTDEETAAGMVDKGRATLTAPEPSWGFLRVFDAETGEQVTVFDDLPGVHELPGPSGYWSIHNTEVSGDIAYSAWYSNGVVALDLSPLAESPPGAPELVGQFAPRGARSRTDFIHGGVPVVWGVAIRPRDGTMFVSDVHSGLWIIQPTGPAEASAGSAP